MTGFGGNWTEDKLQILKEYLNNYLTVFKKRRDYFHLIYIDAFAGSGEIQITDEDGKIFIEGSVKRALSLNFDEFIFIDKDSRSIKELRRIKRQHTEKNITLKQADANNVLKNICDELEWETLNLVAQTKIIDTWILFPISAVQRMLPITRKPEDISDTWRVKLNKIFGDDSWNDLYESKTTLFNDINNERESGEKQIIELYKKRLQICFEDRLLNNTKKFVNSRKRVLFEFIFAAGSPNGKEPAHRIAKHLIKKI